MQREQCENVQTQTKLDGVHAQPVTEQVMRHVAPGLLTVLLVMHDRSSQG